MARRTSTAASKHAPAVQVTPSTPQDGKPKHEEVKHEDAKQAGSLEAEPLKSDAASTTTSTSQNTAATGTGGRLRRFLYGRQRANSDVSDKSNDSENTSDVFDPKSLPVDFRPQWTFTIGNQIPENALATGTGPQNEVLFVSRGRLRNGAARVGESGYHMDPPGCTFAGFPSTERNPISLLTGFAAMGVTTAAAAVSDVVSSRNPQIKAQVEQVRDHEVLVIPPLVAAYYEFVPSTGTFSSLEGTAVVCGVDPQGNTLYVGRAHHQESRNSTVFLCPGYVVHGGSMCRYVFDDKERGGYKYDVLCWTGPRDVASVVQRLTTEIYSQAEEQMRMGGNSAGASRGTPRQSTVVSRTER